jgi:hypothetical protein
MDDLKVLIATTALRDMVRKGWLDICTLRKINEITGNIEGGDEMKMLEALHCIRFSDMPAELQRGLPLLIHRALGTNNFEFDFKQFSANLKLIA